MGSSDDDKRSDFDRMMSDIGNELANTRKELEVVMDELRSQLPSPHDAFEDLRKQQDKITDGNTRSPLQRFKGFVDSNFTLLFDGFKKFPSNVKELKLRMQEEREARQAEELDIWQRWTGSDDSPDHIRMQVERASEGEKKDVQAAVFLLMRESLERNRRVSPQKILDLYRDDEWNFGSLDHFATPMLSFGGACYYKPETVENLPSTAQWGWPLATHRWLSVEWFKRSSYSPIRLESHPDLSDKGEKWRAAFEDLLLISLDKPMQTTEKIGQRVPHGKPQSTYHGPGLDWMLSLQCRGILPPQLPNLYRHYRRENSRNCFRPAHSRILPDLDAITCQRPHCMYPRAETDIQTLVDEVGIQAQPSTDAFSPAQSVRIPQSPWQVPDTEAELYEQFEPRLSETVRTVSYADTQDVSFNEAQEAIQKAVDSREFLPALQRIHEYERIHGEANALLDNLLVFMQPEEIDDVWEQLLQNNDDNDRLRRFEERVDLHERWQDVFERASRLGLDAEHGHAHGGSIDDAEADLDDLECEQRTERALARAERLGYDFNNWDWASLPIEELEAELEREEAYTAARRRGVLAKAARLGYDFDGWEHEDLPVQELEDEMLRMEQYAKRDAQAQPSSAKTIPTDDTKRPDVLSQLTTSETVRLPDGTVTTKVVLKRRFADGREETKESVHTSNEALEAQAMEKTRQADQHRKQKGKGWFWT